MFVSDGRVTKASETAAVLALVAATHGEWYRTANLIEEAGGAVRLLSGQWSDFVSFDPVEAEALIRGVSAEDIEKYQGMVDSLASQGVTVLTVLDDGYPGNLRQVYNRPPMLFVRGHLALDDDRAIAVVGTRDASQDGLRQAGRLATELSRRGITVLSGLAQGIDTAAHEAALGAGGRTVAVMGTGIERIYPPTNQKLADEIAKTGAVISQFWPTAPPTRYSFPMRNVVMSGMAFGTVVVEASATSGAKMQARIALDHGKRLFLLDSLVMHQDWARRYAQRPGTTVVKSVDDIVVALEVVGQPVTQLSLG